MSSSSIRERKQQSYKIFDQIAGTYDLLNRILSCGIDVYWRKKLINHLPRKNDLKVLDLATGTADLALEIGRQKSVAKVEGIDLSVGMIELGKKKVENKGLANKITLGTGDGVNIPRNDDQYDVVTVSFGIRNFYDPLTSLKNMKRVLKPNGKVLVMEFSMPSLAIVRVPYLFYFRKVLPWVGNLLSKHGDAYTYLNKTVEDFPQGKDFEDLMKQAGLKNVKSQRLTFGINTIYSGEKIVD
jgi:demethylmenaquinone methyltransferase/2-methoxy-6-polyprenyl-1,4-benzoquinol methylase